MNDQEPYRSTWVVLAKPASETEPLITPPDFKSRDDALEANVFYLLNNRSFRAQAHKIRQAYGIPIGGLATNRLAKNDNTIPWHKGYTNTPWEYTAFWDWQKLQTIDALESFSYECSRLRFCYFTEISSTWHSFFFTVVALNLPIVSSAKRPRTFWSKSHGDITVSAAYGSEPLGSPYIDIRFYQSVSYAQLKSAFDKFVEPHMGALGQVLPQRQSKTIRMYARIAELSRQRPKLSDQQIAARLEDEEFENVPAETDISQYRSRAKKLGF